VRQRSAVRLTVDAQHHITYDDTGDGPLTIFVHGGLLDRRVWGALVGLVGPRRRSVSLDLRGFGESSPLAGPLDTAVLARDVARLVDALGSPADVVGLSMGGIVCLELANAKPSIVRSVALIGTSIIGPRPAPRTTAAARERRAREDGPAEVARGFTREMLGERADPKEAQLVLSMAASTPLETTIALYRSSPLHQDRHVLVAPLRMPLLSVLGELDALVDPAAETRAAREAGAAIVTVPGAGHLVPIEAPDALAAALQEFWTSGVGVNG
jgi:pimeloyl-ACP methyl ester carboxylesterase